MPAYTPEYIHRLFMVIFLRNVFCSRMLFDRDFLFVSLAYLCAGSSWRKWPKNSASPQVIILQQRF